MPKELRKSTRGASSNRQKPVALAQIPKTFNTDADRVAYEARVLVAWLHCAHMKGLKSNGALLATWAEISARVDGVQYEKFNAEMLGTLKKTYVKLFAVAACAEFELREEMFRGWKICSVYGENAWTRLRAVSVGFPSFQKSGLLTLSQMDADLAASVKGKTFHLIESMRDILPRIAQKQGKEFLPAPLIQPPLPPLGPPVPRIRLRVNIPEAIGTPPASPIAADDDLDNLPLAVNSYTVNPPKDLQQIIQDAAASQTAIDTEFRQHHAKLEKPNPIAPRIFRQVQPAQRRS